MRNIFSAIRKGFGFFKPRKLQPGGHPTIPTGKIIAKPMADGGYSLAVYHGIGMGWISAGHVGPDEDVQKSMQNLTRPVITLNHKVVT